MLAAAGGLPGNAGRAAQSRVAEALLRWLHLVCGAAPSGGGGAADPAAARALRSVLRPTLDAAFRAAPRALLAACMQGLKSSERALYSGAAQFLASQLLAEPPAAAKLAAAAAAAPAAASDEPPEEGELEEGQLSPGGGGKDAGGGKENGGADGGGDDDAGPPYTPDPTLFPSVMAAAPPELHAWLRKAVQIGARAWQLRLRAPRADGGGWWRERHTPALRASSSRARSA